MNAKHIAAYAAIGFGAIGAYSRYSVYNASQSGDPTKAQFTSLDPAHFFGISPGASLFDTGMIIDLALIALGVYLMRRA